MFKCITCGAREGVETKYKPRDRKELSVMDCKVCGHRQLYPLLSEEELKEEYDEDKSVRSMIPTEAMRIKFKEWTKIHADMYWPILQKHKKVLNLGSGYVFWKKN